MNYKNKIQFNYKMTIYTFYQIVCNDSNIIETYVGSTVSLKDRIETHKSSCNNSNLVSYNYKIYQFIRNNGGWSNFKFIILDVRECINKYEAYKIEQSYITELKSDLNCISPPSGLTKQEYYNLHKEKLNKRTKEWKELNKEKNKESSKKSCKQYRQNNKEKISQQKKEQYCCLICKGHYTNNNMSRHFTSNKHKKHLNK